MNQLPPRCERSWIQTFTGRQFWPLNPHADDICIEDIAHALANKCRYTGHTRRFYSVAQHACLCSDHSPNPKWALMHDASEAYLPDVARPVKRMLTGFREIEDHLLQVIAVKYGLPWPMPDSVHEIDLVMLATERRDLMATPPIPWISTERIEPLPTPIVPWSPTVAKQQFLIRFHELFTLDVEGA